MEYICYECEVKNMNPFLKKAFPLLLALIVSLGCLVACNGSQNPVEGTESGAETTEPAVSETTAAEIKIEPVMPAVPDNAAARQIVVDYMNKMADVRWVCKDEMDYSSVVSFTKTLVYKPGQEYFGMPYIGGTANAEYFKTFLDENGVYTGSIKWKDVPGNTCASSIYVAYTTISTDETNASATTDMFPLAGKGMVPVGNYSLERITDTAKSLTKDVISQNGDNAILEAYAMLKPADTILSRWAAGGSVLGHTRLVVAEPEIVRGGNGKIVPHKSYLTITEQCSSFNEDEKTKQTTSKTNFKYSFSDLLKAYYIPLTLEELANDTIAAPEITISAFTKPEKITDTNMLKGTVKSNYIIFEANAVITDSNGNVVARIDRYPNAKMLQLTEVHFDNDITNLPSGEYNFKLTIRIGLGECVYADYNFTVK